VKLAKRTGETGSLKAAGCVGDLALVVVGAVVEALFFAEPHPIATPAIRDKSITEASERLIIVSSF
jgi:hypothetical protein